MNRVSVKQFAGEAWSEHTEKEEQILARLRVLVFHEAADVARQYSPLAAAAIIRRSEEPSC